MQPTTPCSTRSVSRGTFGIWLMVKGFRPSPITDDLVVTSERPAYRSVAA